MTTKKDKEINLAQILNNYIETNNINKTSLARCINMPLSTLTTKLDKNTFTAEDLYVIAKFLGADLSALIGRYSNILVMIKDKAKVIERCDVAIDMLWDKTCSFQIYNEDGDAIYVILATIDSGTMYLILIEDWNKKNELILKIRSLTKIHQFIGLGGFTRIETEDIPVLQLMDTLKEKRCITEDTISYMQFMGKRWLQEEES